MAAVTFNAAHKNSWSKNLIRKTTQLPKLAIVLKLSLSDKPQAKSHLVEDKMTGFEGALLGMGNPLLDIITDVDQAFLDKYQVSIDLKTEFT